MTVLATEFGPDQTVDVLRMVLAAQVRFLETPM